MKRRKFLKTTTVGSLALTATPFVNKLFANNFPDVIVVNNGEPDELLNSALENMGGMARFISSGDVIVIKPNIGWDKAPKYAANTNPDLIAAIVKINELFLTPCHNPFFIFSFSSIVI